MNKGRTILEEAYKFAEKLDFNNHRKSGIPKSGSGSPNYISYQKDRNTNPGYSLS